MACTRRIWTPAIGARGISEQLGGYRRAVGRNYFAAVCGVANQHAARVPARSEDRADDAAARGRRRRKPGHGRSPLNEGRQGTGVPADLSAKRGGGLRLDGDDARGGLSSGLAESAVAAGCRSLPVDGRSLNKQRLKISGLAASSAVGDSGAHSL